VAAGTTLTPDELPVGRLEGFSDGVFAIAITLLVLELSVASDAEEHLLRSILHEWPQYLAYVTSFLTIGVVWLEHSSITSSLRAADATMYRLNLLVLLLVSFLPFPTKLVAEFIGERDPEQVAVVFYGLVLVALDLALTMLWRYTVEHRRLVGEEADEERLDAGALKLGPSLAFYAGAIVAGYLLPTLGVALYLSIAVYLAVPASTIRRLIRRA
jgi:TMEM175 potassium channel family protein